MVTAFFSRRKFGGKRQAANKGFTAKYAENYLSVYDIDLEVVIGPVDTVENFLFPDFSGDWAVLSFHCLWWIILEKVESAFGFPRGVESCAVDC